MKTATLSWVGGEVMSPVKVTGVLGQPVARASAMHTSRMVMVTLPDLDNGPLVPVTVTV